MKIFICSDSHDNWPMLARAVAIANERECDTFMHAGDFISPPGIDVLMDVRGSVHIVWGNNEGEKVGFLAKLASLPHATHHGDVMEAEFDGVRCYMNHYPGIAKNAALSGSYDLVIYGHTHEYREEQMEHGCILVNPGEVQGYRTGASTAMIFDTKTRTIEKITLTA